MAKQTNNLEELIHTSLEEAKKKAYGKERKEKGEEEEMEEEVEAVEESTTTAASSIAAKGKPDKIKHAPDTDLNHFKIGRAHV